MNRYEVKHKYGGYYVVRISPKGDETNIDLFATPTPAEKMAAEYNKREQAKYGVGGIARANLVTGGYTVSLPLYCDEAGSTDPRTLFQNYLSKLGAEAAQKSSLEFDRNRTELVIDYLQAAGVIEKGVKFELIDLFITAYTKAGGKVQ